MGTRFNRSELQRKIKGKGLKGIMRAICGERIGGGVYRDVYIYKPNPNFVVKVERDMSTGQFANATEWRHWCDLKDWTALSKYLAPCEIINATGQILIQRRIIHKRRKDYPSHVLSVFTDLKLKNFGWLDDQFVCCDYSSLILANAVDSKKKYRYAKWRGSITHWG